MSKKPMTSSMANYIANYDDPLYCQREAMARFGATLADMGRVPIHSYRHQGFIKSTMYARSAIEAALIDRYGSVAECRARAYARRGY